MTAKIIPLVTEFDATGMTHGEAMIVASSYNWKAASLQWDGEKVMARRLSDATIQRRLEKYRDATR